MYMSRLEYLAVLRIYPGRVPVYNHQIETILLKYVYSQTFSQLTTRIEQSVDSKRCESHNTIQASSQPENYIVEPQTMFRVYNQQIELVLLEYMCMQTFAQLGTRIE